LTIKNFKRGGLQDEYEM